MKCKDKYHNSCEAETAWEDQAVNHAGDWTVFRWMFCEDNGNRADYLRELEANHILSAKGKAELKRLEKKGN